MEFFRIKKDIPFMKHALVFNAISFITFALAVFFLFSRGLHLSVEFTGGTVMEVAYTQPADIGKVRESISKLGYADVTGDGLLDLLVTFSIDEMVDNAVLEPLSSILRLTGRTQDGMTIEGGDGIRIYTIVPEPATWLLILLACVAASRRGYRRRG